MSVRRAQREINTPEFIEWMAYDRISPFGEERADWRLAQLTAIVANILRGRGKRAKVSDFIWKDKPPRQTVDQQRSIFKAFAMAHNAALAAKGKR